MGDYLVKHLVSHGVDTAFISRREGFNTKVGWNSVTRSGSWRRLDAKPVLFPYIDLAQTEIDLHDFTHLHVGGLQGLLRSAPEATFRLCNSCRARGLSISIGLASGTMKNSDLVRALFKGADMFCNLDEFQDLLQGMGMPESTTPHIFRSVSPNSLLITFGNRGAAAVLDAARLCLVNATGTVIESHRVLSNIGLVEFLEQQLKGSLPARVNQPSCSVGAGDVFAAVYTAASLNDLPPMSALRVAARAASLSILHVTWDDWMSSVPDLHSLLKIAEEKESE